jgi:lipopolysaccharide export LptBFGC system permease protein LptF
MGETSNEAGRAMHIICRIARVWSILFMTIAGMIVFVFYGIISGGGELPRNVALIMLPVLVPGVLFLVSWWRSRPSRDAPV